MHVNQCPDLGLISFSVCSRPTACTVCSQYLLSQTPVRSNYRARSAESRLNDSSVSQSINTCMSKLTSLSFHYYAVQLKKYNLAYMHKQNIIRECIWAHTNCILVIIVECFYCHHIVCGVNFDNLNNLKIFLKNCHILRCDLPSLPLEYHWTFKVPKYSTLLFFFNKIVL